MFLATTGTAMGINRVGIQGCTVVVIPLVLFGVARLVISWFPFDEPSGELAKT